MIQRKSYERIIPKEAQERISQGKCPVCGKERRKQFKTCSPKCNNFFWSKMGVINDWNVTKRKSLERDNHTCLSCGDKAEQVDHIIPICLGGAEFDLANLQSLCVNCHKKKTKQDHKLISKVRSKLKILSKNKSLERWFIQN